MLSSTVSMSAFAVGSDSGDKVRSVQTTRVTSFRRIVAHEGVVAWHFAAMEMRIDPVAEYDEHHGMRDSV